MEPTKGLFDFTKHRNLAEWGIGTDKDIGGHSSINAQFTDKTLVCKGNLSLSLNPNVDAKFTGYVALRTAPKKRLHLFDTSTFDCSHWNYIVMRMRGDHRTYEFNFKPTRSFAGDLYVCRFKFLKPYEWEDVVLPFSHFHRKNCGQLYHRQNQPNLEKIRSFGFLLADNLPGPFAIEIQSIALTNKVDHSNAIGEARVDYQNQGIEGAVGFDMADGMIETKEMHQNRMAKRSTQVQNHNHFYTVPQRKQIEK